MSFGRPHLLIAGLGNLPFPRTRHSVGHYIVDSLAQRYGITLEPSTVTEKKNRGFLAHTDIVVDEHTERLTLFKHHELMNVCGQSIAHIGRQMQFTTDAVVVIADSLYYPPGTLKYKFGGSAQGHGGIKNIIAAFNGSAGFHRILIGIGRQDPDIKKYVLDHLSSYEREYWGPNGQGVDLVVQKIEDIVRKRTLNKSNPK